MRKEQENLTSQEPKENKSFKKEEIFVCVIDAGTSKVGADKLLNFQDRN